MQKIKHSFFATIILVFFWQLAAYASDITYLFAHGLYNLSTLAHYYEDLNKAAFTMHATQPSELKISFKSGHTHSWDIGSFDDMRCLEIQQPLQTFNFPDQRARDFDVS